MGGGDTLFTEGGKDEGGCVGLLYREGDDGFRGADLVGTLPGGRVVDGG